MMIHTPRSFQGKLKFSKIYLSMLAVIFLAFFIRNHLKKTSHGEYKQNHIKMLNTGQFPSCPSPKIHGATHKIKGLVYWKISTHANANHDNSIIL